MSSRADLAICLDRLRRRQGLSYEALEKAVTVLASRQGRVLQPLARSTIGEIVTGKRVPTHGKLLSFLTACQVSANDQEPWFAAWERVVTGAAVDDSERKHGATVDADLAPPLQIPQRRLEDDRLHGRDQVRSELQDFLDPARPPALPKVFVLHGPGGIGKTTIALSSAHLAVENGYRVWWVNAEDSARCTRGLSALAYSIGANELEFRHLHPADVLWNHLLRVPGRWLLVIDNADDVAVLAPSTDLADGTEWLRPPDPGSAGRLLITSRDCRNNLWPVWCAQKPIGTLNSNHGGLSLLDRAPNGGTTADAERLATALGGLPLALDLAGAYISSAGTDISRHDSAPSSFERYRHLMEAKFEELTTDILSGPTDRRQRRSIAGIWELSVDLLQRQGYRAAESTLKLLACFGNCDIRPSEILNLEILKSSPEFPSDMDSAELAATLNRLARFRLINKCDNPPDIGGSSLIHPIVRASILTTLSRTGKLSDFVEIAVRSVAKLSAEFGEDSYQAHRNWADIAPSCFALLRLAEDLPSSADTAPARTITDLAHRAAAHARIMNLASDTVEQLDVVVAARRRHYGQEHPETLSAEHDYIRMSLYDRGNSLKARTEFERLHARQVAALGGSSEIAMWTLHMISRCQYDLGQFDQAAANHQMVYSTRLALHGEQDPLAIWGRYGLARAGYAGGSLAPQEALMELFRFRDMSSRANGPESHDALIARREIARVYIDTGRPLEAYAELVEVISIWNGILGMNHVDTLIARNDLASVLTVMGEREKSIEEFSDVLNRRTATLGEEHPSTIATKKALDLVRSAPDLNPELVLQIADLRVTARP